MITRMRTPLSFFLAGVIAAAAVTVSTAGRKFYDDDPIARAPESRSAAGVKELKIELFFEYAYNLFVIADRKPSNTRAGNLNTIDEVPDSSWFTNRIGGPPMAAAAIARGPNSDAPPAPEKWTLLREKSAGTNPGFTARDANGQTWFLQFDAPEFPEGSTADVEITTKLFWALGYNQVDTFITTFDPSRVGDRSEGDGATPERRAHRRSRRTTSSGCSNARRADADGTYRASAGRLLPGNGARLVPLSGHALRRSERPRAARAPPRAAGAARFRRVDEPRRSEGRQHARHAGRGKRPRRREALPAGRRIDASAWRNNPHEWDMGWEHFYDGPATQRRLLTFGFALSPWQTVPYIEYPSVGLFEGDRFDPTTWKPQTPVAAYMELRADDAFWAARRVLAFNDDLIRAAVHTGAVQRSRGRSSTSRRCSSSGATRSARAYLPAINPIVDPRLDAAGALTFDNAAVAAGVAEAPRAYRAAWSRFDNATGATHADRSDARARRRRMAPPPRSAVEPSAASSRSTSPRTAPAHPTWQQPVRTHFRRTADGWKLVGLERLPMTRGGRDGVPCVTPIAPTRRSTTRVGSSACCRRSPTCAAAKPPSALLMTLTMFLLLGGYYLLKTAREMLHPQRGRRRGEELLVGGAGGAAAGPGAGLRRVRVARQPHAARSVGDAVLRVQPRAVPARAQRRPAHRHRATSSGSASST